ncbi:MAG: hypothetical protein CTR55_22035 [Pseudomonas sp.]|uniref:hypothetical protein n=1 Tax=Pseudomonas sp. TaxID=306 RepID=UPI000CBF5372|nr:hypothetical protein [Pseudomonas sp.]PJI47214.1 MAG: hypothetical protein CTR55_22035 [Pseudomonas sp.]
MSGQFLPKDMRELRAALHRGEPVIEFFIQPPLQVKLVNNRVCLDARCMEVPGVTEEAVARFSFSAEVAMCLLESLQRISFTVTQDPLKGE